MHIGCSTAVQGPNELVDHPPHRRKATRQNRPLAQASAAAFSPQSDRPLVENEAGTVASSPLEIPAPETPLSFSFDLRSVGYKRRKLKEDQYHLSIELIFEGFSVDQQVISSEIGIF